MNRVIAYIDGFNLYFGLKAKDWNRYYWLNIQALVENLLKFNQELVMTKYFTSRIVNSPEKQKRQSTYIEALETLNKLQIFYGKYQLNPQKCSNCGYESFIPNEKMTDVNIAVEILADATNNKFDTALLLSADSDLLPVIKTIKNTFPTKRIVVAFPPDRSSIQLSQIAHACLRIGRANLAKSVFPNKVKKEDGFILRCPQEWK